MHRALLRSQPGPELLRAREMAEGVRHASRFSLAPLLLPALMTRADTAPCRMPTEPDRSLPRRDSDSADVLRGVAPHALCDG